MAEERRVGECSFSVIVKGSDLNVEEISGMLQLPVTKIVRRGEVINRLPEIRADEDTWLSNTPLNNPDGEDEILRSLLQHLNSHRDAIRTLQEKDQIEMKLYVQSDRAQFGYRLMPDTLRLLADTGLPLDVASLSWGEV